jgi:hypothetical protein
MSLGLLIDDPTLPFAPSATVADDESVRHNHDFAPHPRTERGKSFAVRRQW